MKCLVTKLNGVVNNDSLLKLNEIVFYIKSTSSDADFGFSVNGEVSVTTDKNVTLKNITNSTSSVGKNHTQSIGVFSITPTVGETVKVSIVGKQYLNTFWSSKDGVEITSINGLFLPAFTGKKLPISADCLFTVEDMKLLANEVPEIAINNISGNVKDIPSNIRIFNSSSDKLYGNIADLPSTLKGVYLTSLNIQGNINEMPASIVSYSLKSDKGYIAGNIENVPQGVKSIAVINSSVSGSLNNIPSSLIDITCENAKLSGDISSVSSAIKTLAVSSNPDITGDIANAKFYNITRLYVGGTGITGVLDTFLNNAQNSGRTSGSLDFYAGDNDITVRGQKKAFWKIAFTPSGWTAS